MANKIEKIVEEGIAQKLNELSVELVDVEYRKRDDIVNITVFIYREGGVDLDACESVHRAIDPILDEIDPTVGEPYVLNVSSPGLDRAFKTERDYLRNIGEDVEIKFYSQFNGMKRMDAKLLEYNESNIKVLFEDKEVLIKTDKIAKINLAIRF